MQSSDPVDLDEAPSLLLGTTELVTQFLDNVACCCFVKLTLLRVVDGAMGPHLPADHVCA